MLRAKNLHCFLLALLLPVLALLSARPAAAFPPMHGAAEESFQKEERAAAANRNQHQGDCYQHTERLASAGVRIACGCENPPTGGHHFFGAASDVPDYLFFGCSNAGLKQRLQTLLAHFAFQQLLALYP